MARRLSNAHRTVVFAAFALAFYVTDVLYAGAASFHLPMLGPTESFAAITLLGLPLALSVGLSLWRAGSEQGTALAYRDDLTGLLNRRAFVASVEKSLTNARAGTIGVILYDVDGLKAINDDCGHQAGDELLRLASGHLGNATHQNGAAFRIGGDEFAVVVDRGDGSRLAELVRTIHTFKADFEACGHCHSVQMSAGYASVAEGESFDSLFRRADQRLRDRKQRLYGTVSTSRRGKTGPELHSTTTSRGSAPELRNYLRMLSFVETCRDGEEHHEGSPQAERRPPLSGGASPMSSAESAAGTGTTGDESNTPLRSSA
jgi:diguanylate cyclase (GGDEF)-like protein